VGCKGALFVERKRLECIERTELPEREICKKECCGANDDLFNNGPRMVDVCAHGEEMDYSTLPSCFPREGEG